MVKRNNRERSWRRRKYPKEEMERKLQRESGGRELNEESKEQAMDRVSA